MRAISAHPLVAVRDSPHASSPRVRRAGYFTPRASRDSGSRSAGGDDSQAGLEVVRYGLFGGSAATYPLRALDDRKRATDAHTSTSYDSSRKVNAATTIYEDGPLDALAISLFNHKLLSTVEDASDGYGTRLSSIEKEGLPKRGFARLVALAAKIGSSGRPAEAQTRVVTQTLLSLIPPPVRFLFKKLIKPSNWVDEMNAKITVGAFAWLVGPCEVVPRDRDGTMAAVKLKKCRYLEQSGCVGSCVNFCKRPTESFFLQAFGVDAHLAPNHEDGSCLMTFGQPAPVDDPAFQEPCYVTCVNAKDTGSRGDSGKDTSGGSCGPCPKLGNQRS